MLMSRERRTAIRTPRGWAISVLLEVGAKGGRGGGGSPGLHKRVSVVSFPVLSSARKVGETAPAGPGSAGTSPLPARGRSP
jgi:hypothetical protein